jgi:exonuclease SbcC
MEARLPDGELLARHAEAQAQIAHLEHLTEARGAAESDLSDIASRQAALRVENDGLRLAMDECKEQIEALEQAGAECPLCRQDLTDAHRARLLGELQAEGRRYGDVYRSNTREIERLSRHAEALNAQIEQSESLLVDLAALRRQEIALAQRIEHSQEVAPRLEEERRRLRDLDERLASERFGQAHREELADVLQEASALGYDAEAHEAAQKAVAKGQVFADRKATLESAVERVTEEREALLGLQSRVERWHAERRKVQEEQARLRARIEGLEERLAEADKVERALQAARGAEASARQRVGAAQQRLQACIGLERQRADRLERKALLSHKLGLLGELRKAFGIGGVPAMVIEAAVPDIEREANQLLTRLSSGRLKVHLDTQSETLAGDVQETLAVTVVDEYGSRAYESFSGGERFRIDFALRIALSRLLSRRAGAQLQTLVLDEGFGTQDAEGRERLVEAIRAIQDDFRRVLVVTHIDELREAFPTRIEVSKTPNGSVVSMI